MENRKIKRKRRPAVSIVILSWNRKSEVKETLKRIEESTCKDYEIVMVDNASTDGTAEMVNRHFPEVHLIRLPSNRGIYGYNVGFANARGRYVVVLDDDSHPASDAIEKAARVFRSEGNRSIGVIAFRIINNITGREVTSSWPEGDWITFWGCGAAIRREVLEEAGYYDEDFFIYANEYDLSIRVLDAGWRVIYRPDIIAYHRECKKHRSWKRTGWIGARNEAWFHIKHFPWWSLPLMAGTTCLRYIVKGMGKGSMEYTLYSLAGFLRGYVSFRIPLSKRRPVSLRTAKLFFSNHWLLAPFSKKLFSMQRKLKQAGKPL